MTDLIVRMMAALCLEHLWPRLLSLQAKVKVLRLRRAGIHLSFVPQGGYDFDIVGDLSQFSIHETSHIKSATFIECTGGVAIGRYFHPGRGLTIFSVNHNYQTAKRIPYDDVDIRLPVVVGDCVWCGANVTILPGVTIGEGAVIGACSVVTKDVPRCAVMGGNPARVLKYRDIEHFERLKAAGQFE